MGLRPIIILQGFKLQLSYQLQIWNKHPVGVRFQIFTGINIVSKQKVKQIIITPIRFLPFDSCEIIDFINKHKDDNIILYNGRRV
jgi:hypothetical protein